MQTTLTNPTITPTVREIFELWKENIQPKVKISTFSTYVNTVDRYILPYIGEIPMLSLSEESMNSFITDKLTHGKADGISGLSHKTVQDILILLKTILRFAHTHLRIPVPPMQIRLPRNNPTKISIFDLSEQGMLEQYIKADPTPSNYGFLLCLYTGIRLGEICSLQCRHFNLSSGVLSIRQTMQRVRNTSCDLKKTAVIIGPPKSFSSIRDIPISRTLLPYLNRLLSDKSPGAYFLTGLENKYVEPRRYQHRFQACLSNCGIPSKKFHVLRHTFATRCVERDVEIKCLSEILGHSSVEITLNKYVHPSMDIKKLQIEKLSLNI